MNRGGGNPMNLTTNTNVILDGQVVANSTSNYLGTQTTLTSPSRTRIR
jgi:hypothetical protein